MKKEKDTLVAEKAALSEDFAKLKEAADKINYQLDNIKSKIDELARLHGDLQPILAGLERNSTSWSAELKRLRAEISQNIKDAIGTSKGCSTRDTWSGREQTTSPENDKTLAEEGVTSQVESSPTNRSDSAVPDRGVSNEAGTCTPMAACSPEQPVSPASSVCQDSSQHDTTSRPRHESPVSASNGNSPGDDVNQGDGCSPALPEVEESSEDHEEAMTHTNDRLAMGGLENTGHIGKNRHTVRYCGLGNSVYGKTKKPQHITPVELRRSTRSTVIGGEQPIVATALTRHTTAIPAKASTKNRGSLRSNTVVTNDTTLEHSQGQVDAVHCDVAAAGSVSHSSSPGGPEEDEAIDCDMAATGSVSHSSYPDRSEEDNTVDCEMDAASSVTHHLSPNNAVDCEMDAASSVTHSSSPAADLDMHSSSLDVVEGPEMQSKSSAEQQETQCTPRSRTPEERIGTASSAQNEMSISVPSVTTSAIADVQEIQVDGNSPAGQLSDVTQSPCPIRPCSTADMPGSTPGERRGSSRAVSSSKSFGDTPGNQHDPVCVVTETHDAFGSMRTLENHITSTSDDLEADQNRIRKSLEEHFPDIVPLLQFARDSTVSISKRFDPYILHIGFGSRRTDLEITADDKTAVCELVANIMDAIPPQSDSIWHNLDKQCNWTALSHNAGGLSCLPDIINRIHDVSQTLGWASDLTSFVNYSLIIFLESESGDNGVKKLKFTCDKTLLLICKTIHGLINKLGLQESGHLILFLCEFP